MTRVARGLAGTKQATANLPARLAGV